MLLTWMFYLKTDCIWLLWIFYNFHGVGGREVVKVSRSTATLLSKKPKLSKVLSIYYIRRSFPSLSFLFPIKVVAVVCACTIAKSIKFPGTSNVERWTNPISLEWKEFLFWVQRETAICMSTRSLSQLTF